MVLEQLEQFGEEQPVGQYGGSSSGSWERETGNGKGGRGGNWTQRLLTAEGRLLVGLLLIEVVVVVHRLRLSANAAPKC